VTLIAGESGTPSPDMNKTGAVQSWYGLTVRHHCLHYDNTMRDLVQPSNLATDRKWYHVLMKRVSQVFVKFSAVRDGDR